MKSLSLIVITKNESKRIARCLESALFVQQQLVLDSGSTDDTAEIALRHGAEVAVNADWQGFGIQKNRALALATTEWVLSLDADEVLTEELQAEIQAVMENPEFDAYSLPRLSSYCGQYIHHSGWYPDRVVRLFKRTSARFSDDRVHERLIVSGSVGQLRSALLHQTFDTLEEVLDKVNRYSTAGAEGLLAKGKRASVRSAVGHGLWAFFRTYFLRRGFLDGRMGFLLAVSNAEGTYYRYLKLWLHSRSASRQA